MTRREYVRINLPGMPAGELHHTHYRVAGEGPPLILLHPSPMSSAFMQPLIDLMSQQATVYAPDSRPTRVIRWQGSILKRYADRLDDYEWPTHIQMVHAGASIDERYKAIRETLGELLAL